MSMAQIKETTVESQFLSILIFLNNLLLTKIKSHFPSLSQTTPDFLNHSVFLTNFGSPWGFKKLDSTLRAHLPIFLSRC